MQSMEFKRNKLHWLWWKEVQWVGTVLRLMNLEWTVLHWKRWVIELCGLLRPTFSLARRRPCRQPMMKFFVFLNSLHFLFYLPQYMHCSSVYICSTDRWRMPLVEKLERMKDLLFYIGFDFGESQSVEGLEWKLHDLKFCITGCWPS